MRRLYQLQISREGDLRKLVKLIEMFPEQSGPKSSNTLSQISHDPLDQKSHDSESYGGD